MARAIAVASGTADAQAITGSVTLVGVSVQESAGSPAAASLVLRDGTQASDPGRVLIKLAASESRVIALPALQFDAGVFVDRVAGSSELVLYVI